jgi:histone acetyltransferase (RNA polymerase elongator complex component)
MSKEIAKYDDFMAIQVDAWTPDKVNISTRLIVKFVNAAGVEMWKYKYYKVYTKDKVYNVGDPVEYKRILKAMNSSKIRIVRIGNDFVSVWEIKRIAEETGYKEIK